MKRFLAALLAVMLTFSLVSIPVRAEGEVVFTVPTIQAEPGDTVDVTVMIDCADHEMHVLNSYLQFDPEALTVNSITPGSGMSANGGFVLPDFASESGKAKIGAMYPTTGFTGSGVLMTVNFTVSDDAAGSIPLTMVVTEIRNYPVGGTAVDLPYVANDGAVVVAGADPTQAPATDAPAADFNAAANIEGGELVFDNNVSDYPWEVVTERDGRTYVRSTNQGQRSTDSTFALTVNAAEGDVLNFEYQAWGEVSSYSGNVWDGLRVAIDGDYADRYWGNAQQWTPFSLELPAGEHTVTFTFHKDSSTDGTGDFAAIDNVEYVPAADQPTPVPATPAPGTATFVVEPDYQQIEAGDTFELTVSVDGDFEAHMLNFQLNYDDSVFEFVSAQNGAVLNSAAQLEGMVVLDGTTIPGSVRLGVLMPIEPMTETGELFTVTFRAKDNAEVGVYDFTPVVTTFSNAPLDGNNNPVETPIENTATGAQVEIAAPVTEPPVTEPPVTEPPETEIPVTAPPSEVLIFVNPEEQDAQPGDTITFNVKLLAVIGEFEAHTFNLQLNYDSDIFTVTNVEFGEVCDQILALEGFPVCDYETIPGSIRFGALMPTEGFTADGTIFTVTAVVSDNAPVGDYDLTPLTVEFDHAPVGEEPTPIEHLDVPGVVHITEPPVTPVPGTAMFYVEPDYTLTEAGELVSVDIMVSGDYEAHALNLWVDYDSDNFEFVSCESGDVLADAVDNGGTFVLDGETILGSVRLGVLMPQDPMTGEGTLYTLTLRAKETAQPGVYPVGIEAIEFINYPAIDGVETPIEHEDIPGEIEITVPVTPTPEPVTPTPEPVTPTPEPVTPTPEPITPVPGEVTIYVDPQHTEIEHNDEFTFDVKIMGEYEAHAVNLQLNYDSNYFEFVSAANGDVVIDALADDAAVVLDGSTIPGSVRLGVLMPDYPMTGEGTLFSVTLREKGNAQENVPYPLTPVCIELVNYPVEGESTPIEHTEIPGDVEIIVTETPTPEPVTPTPEPPTPTPVPVTEPPIPTPVPGTAVFKVLPETQNAMPGDTITFDVTLEGEFEAHVLNLQLNYDPNVFEILSTARGEVINQIIDLGGTQILDHTTVPGSIRLGAMMPTAGFDANGVIFTVTARIKDAKDPAPEGYHELTPVVTEFTNYPIGGENTPIEHTDIPGYVYVGSIVTPSPVPVTPAPGEVTIYVDPQHTQIDHNDEFVFAVKIMGEYEAHGMNLQLNFDSEHFEFVNAINGDVIIAALNNGATVVADGDTVPGSIRLGVLMPEEPMTGEGTLLNITLREKGTAAENVPYPLTPVCVDLVNYPIDGVSTPIEHTEIPGDVTIIPGSTPMNAVFYVLPNYTVVNAGETFTVDVKVDGSFEAHGLNHQFNYDANNFEFVSVAEAEVIEHITSLNGTYVLDGTTIPGSVRLGVLMPEEGFTMTGTFYSVTLRAKTTAAVGVYDLGLVVDSFVNYPLEGESEDIFNYVIPGEVEIINDVTPTPIVTVPPQPTPVPGMANFIVDAEPNYLEPGQEFQVSVRIEGEYGEAHTLNHQLNYDANVFEFVSYERGPVAMQIIDLGGTQIIDGTTIPGSVRYGVMMPTDGFTEQGIFYTATFRVKDSAQNGTYPFDQVVSEFANFPLGGVETPIEHNIINDNVVITTPDVTPTPAPITPEPGVVFIYAEPDPDVVVPGQEFVVNVRIEGEYEAHGMNLQLNYDTENFEFIHAEEIGNVLVDALDKNATILLDGDTVPGSVRLGVLMPDEPMDQEGILFTAHFRAKETAPVGEYPFTPVAVDLVNFPIGGVSTPIEHYDFEGYVEILPGDTVIFRAIPDPTELIPEQIFTVQATVQNPYEAHGLNFQLNYDANTFEVVSIADGTVVNQARQLGGTVVLDGETVPGSIRLGILMPQEALTAEGDMFTVTFRVKASAQTGDYDFVPNAVEFVNYPLDGVSTPIPHVDIPGTVHIGETEGVIFRAIPDPTVVEPGDTFTVDVTVENPYEAHGLNLQLNYNPAYFEFVSAVNGAVLADAIANGGTVVLEGSQIPGSVRLGVLMPTDPMDQEGVLYTATFRVKDGAPVGIYDFTPVAVDFVNFPLGGVSTPIEHVDIPGQVEIIGGVTPTPEPPTPTPEPPTPTPEPPTPTPEPPTPTPEPPTPTPEPPTPTPVPPTEPPVEPTPVPPTEPPVEPTEPPVEPTEPPVEPTEPPVEPTEPPVEPTEPPVEPTEPPVEPTEPPVEPTPEPTTPPAPPTGTIALVGVGIAALVAGAGIILFRRKED